MRWVVIAMLLAVAPAQAQTKTIQAPSIIGFFQKWADDDIQNAIRIATDFADEDAKACWTKLGDVGKIAKEGLPVSLRLATDIQKLRILAKTLKGACNLKECTQMFQEVANQVNAFLIAPLPISLANVCSKIP